MKHAAKGQRYIRSWLASLHPQTKLMAIGMMFQNDGQSEIEGFTSCNALIDFPYLAMLYF